MKIFNLESDLGLAGLYFIFNTSFLTEKEGEYGINHFLEHLLCSRIQEHENKLTINGISWNAATYSNHIVFYFRGLSDVINEQKNFLIDLVVNAEIKESKIENELRIVLEEYKDKFINKYSAGYRNSFRKIFGVYMPIGDKKSIENFNYKKCISYKINNFDDPLIIHISNKHTKIDAKSSYAEIILNYQNKLKPPKYMEKSVEIDTTSPKDKFAVSLVFEESDKIALLELTCSLLATGLNSPLYDEIRQKLGLSYYVYCTSPTIGNKNYLRIDCCTSDKENIKIIAHELFSIIDNPTKYITKKRFAEIISYELINKKKNDFYKHKDMENILVPDQHTINSVLDISYQEYLSFYEKNIIKLKNSLVVL